MRHNLHTSGAWVDLRDVSDLRQRDRKGVQALVARYIVLDPDTGKATPPSSDTALQLGEAMREAAAAAVISTWHIPYLPDAPLPRLDVDILGDLKPGDYDALMALAAPAVEALSERSTATVTPDDHDRPDSPSAPASG